MKKTSLLDFLKQVEASGQVPVSITTPIPIVVQDSQEVEENSGWQPYKPNKKKCRPDQHWPTKGRCTKCGDIFPCPSGNCGHFDCADPSIVGLDCPGNGTALPEWLNVIEAPSTGGTDLMARAECGKIEIREESGD